MEDILFTVQETSKLLKTNQNLVYELINKGKLPALKLGCLKIRKSSLMKFLEQYDNKDLSDLDNITDLKVG